MVDAVIKKVVDNENIKRKQDSENKSLATSSGSKLKQFHI